MNKEKLEEMILEELMLEADDEEAYNRLAIEIFNDMAETPEGLRAIKAVFPTIEKLRTADNTAKRQIAAVAGEENELEVGDLQTLATLQRNTSEVQSLDQLLNMAASAGESSSETELTKIKADEINNIVYVDDSSSALRGKHFRIFINDTMYESPIHEYLKNNASRGTVYIDRAFPKAILVTISNDPTNHWSENLEKIFEAIFHDDAIYKFISFRFNDEGKTPNDVFFTSRSAATEPASSSSETETGTGAADDGSSGPTSSSGTETAAGADGADGADDTAGADTEADTTDREEDETDLFVPTPEVEDAVEAMKGFYDKPYLFEQGELLRTLIKAIEAALKGEDREAGIGRDRETLQEAKGLNIKNIKASLNAFLQQTRKVKKALQEYIAMAKHAKVGAKRKKGILDKEVDKLIEYGKMILKSLPKTESITEADGARTDSEATTEESDVDLQPLHDFIDFIVGDRLESLNKVNVQEKLEEVKPILKAFPNVAPFGSADGPELDEYENKFKEAIDTHLKTAIANFKSLNSADGGEAAIEGLRTALITFLAEGLTILGKNVTGEEIENLESDVAINSDDEIAPVSNLSPETIMAELGLEISDRGKITTTTDEEKATDALTQIIIKLSTNKRYDTPKEVSDFIYDQVKLEKGLLGTSEEALKGILRIIGARKFIPESKENDFDIEGFAQKFFSEIVKMSIAYRSSKDKEALRQASNKLTQEIFEALEKYRRKDTVDPTDPERTIINRDKTIKDMFNDIYRNLGALRPESIKYNKVLHYMEKNIDRMTVELLIKTVKKIDPSKIPDMGFNTFNNRIEKISKEIFEKEPKNYWNGKIEKITIQFDNTDLDFGPVNKFFISYYHNADASPSLIALDDVKIDDLSDATPSRTSSTTTEQLQSKLEKLVENYINKRKQQWRKRTM
tara:strand:+ start:1149 stop:3896 length:2748 start_codon:yes stop_codon:yes gene_type:complete